MASVRTPPGEPAVEDDPADVFRRAIRVAMNSGGTADRPEASVPSPWRADTRADVGKRASGRDDSAPEEVFRRAIQDAQNGGLAATGWQAGIFERAERPNPAEGSEYGQTTVDLRPPGKRESAILAGGTR